MYCALLNPSEPVSIRGARVLNVEWCNSRHDLDLPLVTNTQIVEKGGKGSVVYTLIHGINYGGCLPWQCLITMVL